MVQDHYLDMFHWSVTTLKRHNACCSLLLTTTISSCILAAYDVSEALSLVFNQSETIFSIGQWEIRMKTNLSITKGDCDLLKPITAIFFVQVIIIFHSFFNLLIEAWNKSDILNSFFLSIPRNYRQLYFDDFKASELDHSGPGVSSYCSAMYCSDLQLLAPIVTRGHTKISIPKELK